MTPIISFAKVADDSFITPLLVDTPGSNEVSQEQLKEIAQLDLETAAAYIYVMSFSDVRNEQDYQAFKAILERDKGLVCPFSLSVLPSLPLSLFLCV